jgi:dTDP-4-amino-4,6-dideoxygalactose transaminase
MINNEEINEAIKVLKSGNYTSGEINKKFEEEFAEYIDCAYAVSCNSGTAALHMALLAIGIGPGDEVIVPSISFFATVSPVMMVGAEPSFCDVNSHGLMAASKIEECITEKTKAIIPVRLHGMPCDMDSIMDLAEKYDLYVIEDCAQAHGAMYKGQRVGNIGDVGCFSFFATKNMTTIEGGMVTTYNKKISDKCKLYRSHGMVDRDNHAVLGYNYRMSELNAAIGRVQLRRLDSFNLKRKENSIYIYNRLSKIDSMVLKFPLVPSYINHVYFWCPVYTTTDHVMDNLKKRLTENGIGFRCRYSLPMYKQPIFKNKYKHITHPTAEKFCKTVIGLPNYPGLNEDELNDICGVMEAF